MCQVQGEGHIVVRLVCRIAEHHALVSRPLVIRVFAFYTTVNVAALLVNGREHAARLGFKLVLAFRVADALDDAPRHVLHIYIRFRFNFSSQDDLSGRDKGFASYFRVFVISQKLIQQSIRYLIGYFIGVSFRHRFGGE